MQLGNQTAFHIDSCFLRGTYKVYCNSLEKHGSIDIGLQLVYKNFSSFLKMWDTQAIFKFSGKIPCFNGRLKTCLIELNMFSRQRITIVDEISSKSGLLLVFKLLNASFNSSSWRRHWPKLVLAELKKSLKSLDELRIENASFGPISVKN